MKLIKFSRVICVNNEIQGHSAKNLLNTEIDPKKNWLCEAGTQRGIVLLELECLTIITAIRIGNANSAFVEVLVGNVGDPTDKYQTLIPPSMFMNCYDSKSGTNPDQVKFFYQKDLCPGVSGKEWNALQIVCTQPFNDKVPFGICFVRVTGLGDELKVVEEKREENPKIVLCSTSKEAEPKEEKKLTMAEEILKAGKSSMKMKAASIKVKPGRKVRKDVVEKDVADNRRNKNFGLEESPRKRKRSQEGREESAPPENKKDDGEKIGRKPSGGRPFSRLMDDVTFVLSGYKNPERSDIRNMALKMGARYSSDWNTRCTHLVCSFENTPKYNEVKGKGKIVKKDWVMDCHRDRKRYPWRRYALNRDDAKAAESEEEIPALKEDSTILQDEEMEETAAGTSTMATTEKRSTRRKPQEKRQAEEDGDVTETDEEQRERPDTMDYPMPHLHDLFSGKTFYIDPNLKNSALIERYIIAYGGIVSETVDETVEFYVTEKGGDVLRIFRKKAPKMRAVRPSWIWEINSKLKWVSPWKFLISA